MMKKKHIGLVEHDKYLEPFEEAIQGTTMLYGS